MDAQLRQALLDVVARATQLRETMSAEAGARRAEAAAVRWVSGDTEGLLSSLPLAARPGGLRRVGRWVGEPDELDRTRVNRVHVDAEDRALMHERPFDGYVLGLWRYDEDRTEEVRYWGGEPHVTWMLHPGGGPAIGAVGADLHERWAERWRWHGEEVARVDRGSAAPDSWASASAAEAELDPDGSVAVLRRGSAPSDFRDDNRLGEDEWLPALEDALDRAGELVCDHVVWIAARDAPAALRADVSGLAEELADALAAAITAAARASDLPRPFCVLVTSGRDRDDGGHRTLPPRALLVDDAWRRGMVASSPDDGDAIHRLGLDESRFVVALDVASRLDRAALRACAELDGALDLYADHAESARAKDVLAELREHLTVRLGESDRFDGATPDFLPLVLRVDDRSNDPVGDALDRARRHLGPERVDAFVRAMRSQAPARDGIDADLAKRALTDRDALEELLGAVGLGARAERLAHEVADVGFLLRGSDANRRSRLGGPAVLPPAAAWPTGPHGRPLSFLAGVDLSELPARGAWPTAGWWLFYAELGEDEDGWGFYEPEDNHEGARARMLHIPQGIEPVTCEPPAMLADEGLLLGHRRIDFEPVLTLPDESHAMESLGLDPFEARAYEAAQDALWDALGEPSWKGGQHWVAGHVSGAQGEPPEAGTELLLHLANDDSLGFSFLDAGTIQFRIPAEALARGDYAAVRADPSSC
jgi:Domain of unknown function (DUF1963)